MKPLLGFRECAETRLLAFIRLRCLPASGTADSRGAWSRHAHMNSCSRYRCCGVHESLSKEASGTGFCFLLQSSIRPISLARHEQPAANVLRRAKLTPEIENHTCRARTSSSARYEEKMYDINFRHSSFVSPRLTPVGDLAT